MITKKDVKIQWYSPDKNNMRFILESLAAEGISTPAPPYMDAHVCVGRVCLGTIIYVDPRVAGNNKTDLIVEARVKDVLMSHIYSNILNAREALIKLLRFADVRIEAGFDFNKDESKSIRELLESLR